MSLRDVMQLSDNVILLVLPVAPHQSPPEDPDIDHQHDTDHDTLVAPNANLHRAKRQGLLNDENPAVDARIMPHDPLQNHDDGQIDHGQQDHRRDALEKQRALFTRS